jgi:UDP-N-acetylglucosamine acyltransferase
MPTVIHPTAIIDSQAQIHPTVHAGPYAVIEGPVKIGAHCHLHAHAKVTGPTTLGNGNTIHSFAVIGDAPQDLKFKDQTSELVIGDNNIFREHVTVHRGTNGITRIGSNCFLMVGSHVGHNAVVHDFVTLVNGARLGGHSEVYQRAIVGAGCAIHQNARVGRLAMVTNNCAQLGDIPPYCISTHTAVVTQINHVGLRRSGMSKPAIDAVRQMFKLLMRDLAGVPLPKAIGQLPPELLAHPEVREFVEFVKTTKRGVAKFQPWSQTTKEKGGGDAVDANNDDDGQNQ